MSQAPLTDPGTQVAGVLIHLLMTSIGAYVGGSYLVKLAANHDGLRGLLYGWADELVKLAPTRIHIINAFVVTDIEHEGASIGYEGVLVDLRQDSSGQIKSAALRDVQAFILRLANRGLRRERVDRAAAIPFLVVEAENIKNLALSIYLDTEILSTLDPSGVPEWERRIMIDEVRAALADVDRSA